MVIARRRRASCGSSTTEQPAPIPRSPASTDLPSPILGIHLPASTVASWRSPHCVLVRRGVQWLFWQNDDGSDVRAVISAAGPGWTLRGDRRSCKRDLRLPARTRAPAHQRTSGQRNGWRLSPQRWLDAPAPGTRPDPAGSCSPVTTPRPGRPGDDGSAARSGSCGGFAAEPLHPRSRGLIRRVWVLPGLAVSPQHAGGPEDTGLTFHSPDALGTPPWRYQSRVHVLLIARPGTRPHRGPRK